LLSNSQTPPIETTNLKYQNQITLSDFPYCAFNGGGDVWFDIGNKKVGIECLQRKFGKEKNAVI
jgi:IMP and pyridine-specific 5'-nucleotidase